MKYTAKKYWGRSLLLGLVIGIITYLVSYFYTANSPAFSTARDFIIKSPLISVELGSVNKVRLAPLGYEIETAGTDGSATFECVVIGEKSEGKVLISLKSDIFGWKVVKANLTLPNKEVPLVGDLENSVGGVD